MNKEEIVIYVFATTNEMRECFKTYEHLFDKYSKINCYGILKNGLKIQFTNEIRGLRKIKTYDEIKIYLQEMNNQQENQSLKKENKILRENAEHNDKIVDKVNWENQKLKKQLEEANEKILLLQASEPILEYKKALEENHQKEFIEFLESYLKLFDNKDIYEEGYYDCIEEILLKYKEIIKK